MSAQGAFEPEVELTEPFYRVLAELTTQVRTWEEKAPGRRDAEPRGHGEAVGAVAGGLREAR